MQIENRIDEIFVRALSDHKGSMPFKAVRKMVEEIKVEVRMECASLSYARRYYDEHAEERKAYGRAYYQKKREQLLEKGKKYREEHREELKVKRNYRRKKKLYEEANK